MQTQFPPTDAQGVVDYYERGVFPKLKPHQRALFVPGLFGCTTGEGAKVSLAEQAQQLALKLEMYHTYMRNNSGVVGGLNPWHFMNRMGMPNRSDCDMRLGAMGMPEVVMEAVRKIGRSIIGAGGV